MSGEQHNKSEEDLSGTGAVCPALAPSSLGGLGSVMMLVVL